MKKLILILVGFLGLLSFAVISCNKAKEKASTETVAFSEKSDNEKLSIISKDDDWKYIAAKNVEIITKLVNSNIDINSFDFENESEFLKVIGTSKTEYLDKATKAKDAANRLIKKYSLSTQSQFSECISCKTNKTEEFAKLKRIISLFRNNKEAFSKFQSLLVTPNLAPDGGGGGGACCGWRFYPCVALCAGTIEAFPLYLLCCAFCYDTYCCK